MTTSSSMQLPGVTVQCTKNVVTSCPWSVIANTADEQGNDLWHPSQVVTKERPTAVTKEPSEHRTHTRPIGPKRTIPFTEDSTNPKRICNPKQKGRHSMMNAQMIQQLDPSITTDEAATILHDYKQALKILKSKYKSTDSIPTLEYMIKLINDWKPKRNIICMYVRWSKRLRRNYHLDSISTLLCVAEQCDYTPHVFLKNIKTLSISSSTATYGLNFIFNTSNNQAIDGKKLNEKFLGLSITLRLLQKGVVSNVGTLGNVGLKTCPKRKDYNDGVCMPADIQKHNQCIVANQPTSRFHTNGGLLGRIWLAIQHRWIAVQVVEMLFPTQLAKANTEQESLAFSFRMLSSAGPTRYDFLDPIIGVCLRFRSTLIIDNHASILGSVWDEPSSFVPFGNRFLNGANEKDKVKHIVEAFQSLKSMMKNRKKVTLHLKTDRETKWQMIRGYAFHFWLERVKNQTLKLAVDCACKEGQSKKQIRKTKLSSMRSPAPTNITLPSTPTCPVGETMNECETSMSGLSKLLTTRRVDTHVSEPSQDAVQETQQFSVSGTAQNNILPIESFDHSSFVWGLTRLATILEVASRVSSHLLIHRDDGVDLIAELSPLEVYSADKLFKFRHSRMTGPQGYYPKTKVGGAVFTVNSSLDKFLDVSSKVYHVARDDSNYFKEHGHLIPSMHRITSLCQAVMKYGIQDTSRCTQQFRVNVGCGGQHRPKGKPEILVGQGFKTLLVSDSDYNDEEIMETIGKLTEFTWNVLKDIQLDVGDCPLAPDQRRHQEYACHLSNYLKANSNVGFEDVTVVVGVLYPLMPKVIEHIDSMNDSVVGYTRTGVFSVVLSMEHKTGDPVLLHLQVICNFRRVIREYLLPCQSLLTIIAEHCKQYLAKWQNNMYRVFGGTTDRVPKPFERKNFFVDDCLPFQTINISSGGNKVCPSITGQYLLTEISPSRMLSFSMFIDPIVDLRAVLCNDQRIELCFVASMLSNPFWFEHTLTSLTKKNADPKHPFNFGLHPLIDWAKETICIFGAWQGGPHNRWSPCGGGIPFPNLFGAHEGATEQEQRVGAAKLEAVIQVLYHHLQWVNSLDPFMSDPVHDLPISMIDSHMSLVADEIFKIVPCQFNIFRLLVFTTLAAGCGEIQSGIHLKALTYPMKGSASFKHLTHPIQDQLTRRQALSLCSREQHLSNLYGNENEGVQSDCHDQLMLYLSNEIGLIKYLRDETECVLCEAHPNRNLQCRDWFKKGRRIYDWNMDGCVIQREYGKDTQWVEMDKTKDVTFAFLKEVVTYKESDNILIDYALAFGEVLQKSKDCILFCGRNTKTSDFIQQYNNEFTADMSEPFSGICHRAANFYNDDYTSQANVSTMQVLGDREVAAVIQTACNNIASFPDGLRLWTYVLKKTYGTSIHHRMYSARYHQHAEGSDDKSKTLVFPAHLDKAFVDSAIFVPLTKRDSFTVIAVPRSWNIKQDNGSNTKIQEWMERISEDDRLLVLDYLSKFQLYAGIFMKVEVQVRVFFNAIGSVLLFPANKCFHTTIIPGNLSNIMDPRDLFIIHPTISATR
jgi:hypothetical protein